MSSFDKIIGYDTIKKELIGISDMIHNKEFLEKLAEELIKKETLLSSDVQKIRESVTLVETVS